MQIFMHIRQRGAVLIDNLKTNNIETILNFNLSGEATAMIAEFKIALNAYLKDLVASPVRSLADVIASNQKLSDVVRIVSIGLWMTEF